MNPFKSRKFKQGSLATVTTALVVALIVIANMVATALSSRFGLILDLTPNKAFSLTQESVDLVSAINKDVTFYVLSGEDEFASAHSYYMQANEVLKRYSQLNQRIQIVYVDIIKDPTFTTRYPNLTLYTGNILLDCEGRTAVLDAYDLFNVETDYYSGSTVLTSSKAERAMSSALLNVTSETKVTVSVLSGHNEADITALTDLLAMNNFNVVRQNLMTDPDVDPEATIAILAAPLRDISEDEAKKLDRFLSNEENLGKTLFYVAGSTQPSEMPVLDAFLGEWGIKVNPGVVFESNQSMLFLLDYFATLADYSEYDYSADVWSRSLYMGMPASRPLEMLFESKSYTEVAQLLGFSASAGVMPPEAGSDWSPAQADVSGPIPALLLSSEKRITPSGTPIQSNVLVSGSSDMVSEYFLGNTNLANSDYVLNLLNKLSGREVDVRVQNKTLGGNEMGINGSQIISISVALVIVFPLLVLVSGVVIWLRRRHK